MMDTYDLIAIGAGPAGESATELASIFGHRSAIVAKHRPGGTVTTTGGTSTPGDPTGTRAFASCCKRLRQTTLRCAMWTISRALPNSTRKVS